MNDDRVLNALEHISDTVSDIKVGLASMQTIVQQHEKRLEKLEDDTKPQKNDTFKDEMLKLLVKAVIVSLAIIGSLTGASAAIKQVLAAAVGGN